MTFKAKGLFFESPLVITIEVAEVQPSVFRRSINMSGEQAFVGGKIQTGLRALWKVTAVENSEADPDLSERLLNRTSASDFYFGISRRSYATYEEWKKQADLGKGLYKYSDDDITSAAKEAVEREVTQPSVNWITE